MTLIAAKGDLVVQAQADTLQVAAKLTTTVQSATKHIDIAAAKKITIATAGGASITIENGQISVKCPGTITVHAGSKSFVGPGAVSYPLPVMPNQVCKECLLAARASGSAFATR